MFESVTDNACSIKRQGLGEPARVNPDHRRRPGKCFVPFRSHPLTGQFFERRGSNTCSDFQDIDRELGESVRIIFRTFGQLVRAKDRYAETEQFPDAFAGLFEQSDRA